jgi:hypothetical protein
MENSQRVNEAIEKVFAKLFAMTQEELDARLAKRKMGPIGRVFLDRAINDELPDEKSASIGRVVPRASSI